MENFQPEISFSEEEQKDLEHRVARIYHNYKKNPNAEKDIRLLREEHVKYLKKGLISLSSGYQSLDASRPWLCYWILHALELLDALPPENQLNKIATFLSKCQNLDGGFGGGPDQISHLAPTYAAVNALVICGTEHAYNVIDRKSLYNFLISMKDPKTGGFLMHKNGESDVRGAYCALSAASILNIMTPELIQGVPEYIASCQTYEGGMGGEPGNEAHGGYTFCALAALFILNKVDLIDKKRLIEWAVYRQMDYEGGFQGRTNKLVDACYSFWQGGLFPLISTFAKYEAEGKEAWLFRQKSLQEYLLVCCQPSDGGFIDKPGKTRDYYHTCYALSGLSIAQHNNNSISTLNQEMKPFVIGPDSNLLELNDAVYNIGPSKLAKAFKYFATLKL